MQQEFISYDQALALKELGFDEPCLAYFDAEKVFRFPGTTMCNRNFLDLLTVTTPLKQQAFRWFREKHKLWAYNIPYSGGKYCIEIWRLVEGDDYAKTREDRVIMDSWEEAEKACLDKLIEICKTKINILNN